MRIGAAKRMLCLNKDEHFGDQLRLCHAHRVDSPPPRYSTPSGSPRLVQGRRRVVVAWAIQREYD